MRIMENGSMILQLCNENKAYYFKSHAVDYIFNPVRN